MTKLLLTTWAVLDAASLPNAGWQPFFAIFSTLVPKKSQCVLKHAFLDSSEDRKALPTSVL
jgi:hypothetical protein